MPSVLSKLGMGTKATAGTSDPNTYTMWTTPWTWKTNDSVYVSESGAWMYRCLDLFPLEHEDEDARMQAARQLYDILVDIGRLARDNQTGVSQLDRRREVHLLSITWDELLTPPEDNPQALKTYQQQAFGFAVPNRLLAVGVKLEHNLLDKIKAKKRTSEKEGTSWLKSTAAAAMDLLNETVGNDVPSLEEFADDRKRVATVFNQWHAHIPTKVEAQQIEGWFNNGRTPDVEIDVHNDYLEVLNGSESVEYEFSVVHAFENQELPPAPYSQWIFDTLSLPVDAPKMVSIRGELERPAATRTRGRRATRRRIANLEEEKAAGDLEKVDKSDEISYAEEIDRMLASERTSIMSRTSFIFAREVTQETESYMSYLQQQYGVVVKSLPRRQLAALDEVQPGSVARVNPKLQDVTIPMIAYAGLQAFAALGDHSGAYMGLVNPESAPLYIDPWESSRQHLPPVFCVFGEPGSGKTFLAQNFGTQCVLMGMPVIFINPKGGSSLIGMVNYINETQIGATARRISMSAAEQEAGSFDPFRFATPARAAEIAFNHIMSAFQNEFSKQESLVLANGLTTGAEKGAQCVMDALQHIADPDIRDKVIGLVKLQARSSRLYALGIGEKPQERLDMSASLTLIDFDREIGLPDPKKQYSDLTEPEKIAIAAINLITTASLEILLKNRGGVLILDEAWTFLQQPSALQFLNRIAREGRSLNVIPMFLTQRIKDAITYDMESYISRVMVLQMKDPEEAKEAFRICGLKLTESRRKWLMTAGPSGGTFAQGLFRDLRGRHSVVDLGPFPESARQAWSTAPQDALLREKALQKEAEEKAKEVRENAAATGETPFGAVQPEDPSKAVDPSLEEAPYATPGEAYGVQAVASDNNAGSLEVERMLTEPDPDFEAAKEMLGVDDSTEKPVGSPFRRRG